MAINIDTFIDWVRLRNPQAKTWKDYRSDLQIFISAIGGRGMDNIRPKDLDEFIHQQIEKGHKPSTINRRLSAIVSFYSFTNFDRQKLACPVIPRRHYLPEPQRLPRPVHEKSLTLFFNTIDNLMDRAMFTLMLRCGLRIGEVAGLKMSDLYLDEYPPRLIIQGKGGKERSVFLSNKAVHILTKWLRERGQVKSDFVFITYQHLGISTTSISVRMKHIRDRCGVTFTAHQLRHTFADQLLSAGMPITSIQKLLGHRFLETTQNYAMANDLQVQEDFYQASYRLKGWARIDAKAGGIPAPYDLWEAIPETSLNEEDRTRTQIVVPPAASLLPKGLLRQLITYCQLKSIRWRNERVSINARNFLGKFIFIWKYLIEHWDIHKVSELRRDHILSYIKFRMEYEISVSTINGDLSALRAFLTYLKDDGVYVHPSLDSIRRLKQTERLPRYISAEQANQLGLEIEKEASHTEGGEKRRDLYLLRAVFYLLWQGGMRVGEIEELKISDVYISTTSRNRRLFVRDGKWRKGRIIYLSDAAYEALRKYFKFLDPDNKEGFVFTRKGVRLKKGYICKVIKEIGKRINIKVVPHRLRHTFGTQLLNAGCRITSIQRLLGHRSLDTTMIYAKALDATVVKDYLDAMSVIEPEYQT